MDDKAREEAIDCIERLTAEEIEELRREMAILREWIAESDDTDDGEE